VELALVGGGRTGRLEGRVTAWWLTRRSDPFSHCRKKTWKRVVTIYNNKF